MEAKSRDEIISLIKYNPNENYILVANYGGGVSSVEGIKGLKISFSGTGNIVILYENELGHLGRFRDSEILLGEQNFVSIMNTKFTIRNLAIISSTAKCCQILIGRNFSCGDCLLQVGEGSIIKIGNNCMFAGGISIRNSDFHAIYEINTKELLNPGADIIVEDHVWIAFGVTLLKGVKISQNSVVGAGSIVTKKFLDSNVVIAGNPGKIVRTNINWTRTSPADYS